MLHPHEKARLEKVGPEKIEKLLACLKAEIAVKYAGLPTPIAMLYGIAEAEVQEWLEEKEADAIMTPKPKPSIFVKKTPKPAIADAPVTVVYTDGGAKAAPPVGAWAWWALLPNGETREQSKAHAHVTNNQMELRAVIEALETLEIGPPIKIVADSEYVLKGMQFWLDNWVKHDWKTVSGGEVKNRELWERLLILRDLHNLDYQHVDGHSGDHANDYVDGLCAKAMAALAKTLVSTPLGCV
jgi:ribonuclease HI